MTMAVRPSSWTWAPSLQVRSRSHPGPSPLPSRTTQHHALSGTRAVRRQTEFNVKTGSIIGTKVDIWSTLYVCLVGKSLFEALSEETGGSLSMCVLGGDWRFHDEKSGTSKGRPRQAVMRQRAPLP